MGVRRQTTAVLVPDVERAFKTLAGRLVDEYDARRGPERAAMVITNLAPPFGNVTVMPDQTPMATAIGTLPGSTAPYQVSIVRKRLPCEWAMDGVCGKLTSDRDGAGRPTCAAHRGEEWFYDLIKQPK